MRQIALAFAAAAALAIAGPAQAVIFTLGNNPQPGEQSILFADQSSVTTLIGTGNVTPTDTLTLTGGTFSVSTNVITAASGDITAVTITPSSPLTALIFNPQNGPGANLSVDVTTNLGIDNFLYSLGSGNNFLTITTGAGEFIQSVALTSGVGFEDLATIRASFVPATDNGVPEPATWAMMLLGFGAIGVAMRRRRSAALA